MKLQTLRLENFQGVKEAIYTFNGQDFAVYGNNATGKTSIYNAFTWLILGKPSTDAKGYRPKPQDENGNDIHYLTNTVEAEVTIDTGETMTLRKSMEENYVKKKGSTSATFEGHIISYFVNSVPMKETEYKATIERLLGTDEQCMILMTSSFFAKELPWEKRRKILLEMHGDIDDHTAISSEKQFKGLLEVLTKPGTGKDCYTVDEYKKIAAAQSSEIKKEIQSVPARIDEATKAMPNLEEVRKLEDIQTDISDLEKLIAGKRDALSLAKSTDGSLIERQKEINQLQTEIAEARIKHIENHTKLNESIYHQISDVDGALLEVNSSLNSCNMIIEADENKRLNLTNKRENLYNYYQTVAARQFESEENCPTCGQSIPLDQVQTAKSQFNIDKSELLEKINIDGQDCSKEVLYELKKSIKATTELIEKDNQQKEILTKQRSELQAQLVPTTPFEETVPAYDLAAKLERVLNEEDRTNDKVDKTINSLHEGIARLTIQLDDLKVDQAQYDIAEKQQVRIAELEKIEKKLAVDFEKIQKGLHLCDEFTKWKVSHLTDQINSSFKTVTFKLFDIQINGGLKECCEVLVKSDSGALVSYNSSSNTASNVNAGLEIVNVLSEHWNKSLPIFIDQAESVTEPIGTVGQRIRLIVSKEDKVLRFEVEENLKSEKGA